MRQEGHKLPDTLEQSANLVEGASCPNCGERLSITEHGGVPDITCTRCGSRVMLGTVEVKFEVVKRDQ